MNLQRTNMQSLLKAASRQMMPLHCSALWFRKVCSSTVLAPAVMIATIAARVILVWWQPPPKPLMCF